MFGGYLSPRTPSWWLRKYLQSHSRCSVDPCIPVLGLHGPVLAKDLPDADLPWPKDLPWLKDLLWSKEVGHVQDKDISWNCLAETKCC